MDSSIPPYRGYIAMTIIFIIVLAGTVYFLRRPEPVPLSISTAIPRSTPTASVIVVQMCGAITHPGIYTLSEGSRVQDALRIAGNPLSSGDTSVLNLARKLNDGEQICVPSLIETPLALPASTLSATPKPISSCISYKDAISHMGETKCVRGSVTSMGKSGKTFFIYFDNASDSFYAVSFQHTWDNLRGKCVEVNGNITMYRGDRR